MNHITTSLADTCTEKRSAKTPNRLRPRRYALYARQNTDDARMSNDHQIARLRTIARQRRLHTVEEIIERGSARAAHRPLRDHLLHAIEQGQIDAVLCWDFSRLSRNPVDAGRLLNMLQTGLLREIHTPAWVHRPEGDVVVE